MNHSITDCLTVMHCKLLIASLKMYKYYLFSIIYDCITFMEYRFKRVKLKSKEQRSLSLFKFSAKK